jgi:hypothetical protein
MAKAFKFRVGNLVSKFLAHTLDVLTLTHFARAIATLFQEPVLDGFYDLFIGIQGYFHSSHPFFLYYSIVL